MKKGKFIIGTGEKAAKLLLALIFLGFIFLDLSVSQCTPPAIVTQPISQSVMEGQSVTFAVVASGTDPLSYQWQKNGVDIPGATSSSLTTGPVALSDNGAKYRVIVTNSCGSATSVEAILAVKAKVLHIPQNQGHTTIGNQKAIAIGSNKAANNIEITSTERE